MAMLGRGGGGGAVRLDGGARSKGKGGDESAEADREKWGTWRTTAWRRKRGGGSGAARDRRAEALAAGSGTQAADAGGEQGRAQGPVRGEGSGRMGRPGGPLF
jgi:hypothetical protein